MNVGCGTALIRSGAAAVAAALISFALVAPVLGGGPLCSLQATVGGGSATEVRVGEEVLIEGFGFAPGDVEVSYSVGGTPIATETVTADGSGIFETTVTPVAGQEGLWTVTATDVGEVCTAETGFLVIAGRLPNAAAVEPRGPSPLVLGGLLAVAAAAVLARGRLARPDAKASSADV